jgi:hypothetical protein
MSMSITVSKRSSLALAATFLAVTSVSSAERKISDEDWPTIRKVNEAVQKELLPRALEACRAIDPVSALESCEPANPRLYTKGTVAAVYLAYHCRMRRLDPTRGAYILRVELPASLGRRDGAWTTSPIVFAPDVGTAPPEDQFRRGGQPTSRSGYSAEQTQLNRMIFSRLFNAIRPTMIWWPETFGTLVLCGLILYVTWGGGARRQGVRGTVATLNIATGLIGGFLLGLALWHALPQYITSGGPGGSTPLHLYLILPAPLGSLTAVVSWVLLGSLWSVIQRQSVRFVPIAMAALQIGFCLITLNVILECVIPR